MNPLKVAELSRGRRIRVTSIDGQTFYLDEKGNAEPLDIAQLKEVDEQVRVTAALVGGIAERLEAVIEKVEMAVANLNAAHETQAALATSLKELTQVMKMPLESVYDGTGKLLGARRVEQLEKK